MKRKISLSNMLQICSALLVKNTENFTDKQNKKTNIDFQINLQKVIQFPPKLIEKFYSHNHLPHMLKKLFHVN